jgi:ketosteroid isomerase-like protein
MKATWAVLPATVLMACGGRPTPGTPTLTEWNEGATQEVRTQVQRTMGAFASADLEAFKSGLAEDVAAFEMDLESKPVRLGSREEVVRYAATTFGELKKMGATLKLDVHSTNCYATSTLAYCTVEFDAKATMGDGSTISQPSRNSIVLRRGEAGWKWAHWHSSLAVAPPPPPGK